MRKKTLLLLLWLLLPMALAATDYNIKIGGKKITSENCANITSANGFTAVKSGTVTFNPTTNTLTLNNAKITAGSENAIYFDADGTIELKGTNTLTGLEGLLAIGNVVITGGGKATFTGASNDCGIYIPGATVLTISDCTVTANGGYGIAGKSGTVGESLAISYADVYATGSTGSICDLASLTLTGCSITSPAGAAWNSSKHGVVNSSGTIISGETVKIEENVELSPYVVVVETTAGQRMEYRLSDEPRIVFAESEVTITTKTTTVDFSPEEIKKVYMAESTNTVATDIRNVKVQDGSVSLQHEQVSFSGYAANEPVMLFTVDGRQLKSYRIGADGQLTISLSQLPAGIYIIKTSHQSIKITKK